MVQVHVCELKSVYTPFFAFLQYETFAFVSSIKYIAAQS